MPRPSRSLILGLALLGPLAACGGDDAPAAGADAAAPADSGARDAASPKDDAAVDAGRDASAEVGPDAGPDVGADDAGVTDGGASSFALDPGSGLSWPSGQITIGADTFGSVRGRLGAGVRDAAEGARSYTWTVSGFELTVWFANTNLDGDDAAPNDVDDGDRVLWASVRGGFGGQTPEGIGLGSTRAEIEAAYGPAPNESTASPSGRRLAYYTRGLLVTLDPMERARTVTVSRSYPTEPGGTFDFSDARLELPAGRIQGTRGIGRSGTSRSDIQTLLGPPDGTGTITFGRTELTTWSYGFFGLELFFLGSSENLLFLTLHAPYYGTSGSVALGSPRTEVESRLRSEGYASGAPSSSSPRLICYGSGSDQVGVTYDEADRATTFTFRLLTCP